MRLGTPLFITAFSLLCLGLASTSRSFWENPYSEINQPLSMENIHTLDITGIDSVNVMFDSTQPSRLHYSEYQGTETNLDTPKVSVSNGVMIINFDPAGYNNTSLYLPSTVKKIVCNNASFSVTDKLDNLTIQANEGLSWNGDATSLKVIADNPNVETYQNEVRISDGKINDLVITAVAHRIDISNSHKINNIALRTTRKSSLALSDAIDLSRIKIEQIPVSDDDVSSNAVTPPPSMKQSTEQPQTSGQSKR
jgi:hypothetical protein